VRAESIHIYIKLIIKLMINANSLMFELTLFALLYGESGIKEINIGVLQ
jgi:hypothetical protein